MPSTTFPRPISTEISFLKPTWKERNWWPKRRGNSHGQALAVRRPALQATAQVREYSHWSAHVGFPSPCPYVPMKLAFFAPTHDWQGGSHVSWAGRFVVHSLFRAFRSAVNANLIQDVCFLTRDGKFPFILGADFNFPPNSWQDLSMYGGSLWLQKLGASVAIPEGTTHTCRVGKGQKPDSIDYFFGVNTSSDL